jgi:hypothetical protein
MYVKLECNSIRGDTYAWAIRHWQPHTAPDHYVEDVQSDLHNTNRKSWRGIEKTRLSQQISWRSFIEPYNLVNGFDLLTLVFERHSLSKTKQYFLFVPAALNICHISSAMTAWTERIKPLHGASQDKDSCQARTIFPSKRKFFKSANQ